MLQHDKVKRADFLTFPIIKEPLLQRLYFPQLESISMHLTSRQHDMWVAFFARHSDIKTLKLVEGLMFEDFRLDEITANLKELVEVEVECRKYVSVDVLTNFIRSHKKLMKFTISMLDHEEMRELRRIFENEWHISSMNQILPGLIFEKKTPAE